MEEELNRQEKGKRRRKNSREQRVIDAYLKDGWQIIARGMPAFLARKPGHPFRAVWVERQNIVPEKAGLTQTQTFVRSIFMTKEIDCRIETGICPLPSSNEEEGRGK